MKQKIKRLENKGYNVTFTLSGWWIASKFGRNYKADTITGLYNLIFKPI